MKHHVPTAVVTASFEGILTAENTLDHVAEPPYDTNFVSLRHLNDEREQALIERARSGDRAARDEMFLWLLSPVERFARRYYLAHYWEAPGRVSPDDLVSEAMVRMLEQFSRALAVRKPFAYLLIVAYGTIRKVLSQERSPIRTPYTPGERPIPVKSLNVPLTPESDETLLDVIPADVAPHATLSDEQDAIPLYEAAARLSESERAVIAEWYGVYETAPASMEALLTHIGRAHGQLQSQRPGEVVRPAGPGLSAVLRPGVCARIAQARRTGETL